MSQVFCDVGWTDGATICAGNGGATNAEQENILTDRRSEFWRTPNNLTNAAIHVDLGQVRPIQFIAVMDVFGPVGAEMQVRFDLADACTGGTIVVVANNLIAATAADGGRHAFWFDEGTQGFQFVNVRLSHTATAQPLGFSRVVIGGPGTLWVPDPGMLVGSGVVTPGSASEVTETEAGGRFIRPLFTRRRARPVLEVSRDQYIGPFWDIAGFSGSNRPVMFIQDTTPDFTIAAQALEANKGMLYGPLPDLDAARVEFHDGYAINLDLEEWT